MFATDRLLICPYTEADIDDLLMLWSDQRLAATTGLPPRGPQFRKTLSEQMVRATFAGVIKLKETHEFMGQILVHSPEQQNRDGTYGICLLPKFWNRGYGTEATLFMVDYSFRWIGLHRVSLSVFASNARAIAVYEKAGFVMEGRKRAAVWTNNQWEDVLSMGLLQDEWVEKLSILDQ
ncbi:acyl-CoA N-acyltransferase [Melanogaster broomeanus]|nr:acyl-CoA N-acyltransferase [Melanogaster broomeanus]